MHIVRDQKKNSLGLEMECPQTSTKGVKNGDDNNVYDMP